MSGTEDAAATAALTAAEPRLRRMASVLHRTRARDLDPDDLLQEGRLAFWLAWGRAGVRLPIPYAMARAEWAMRTFIRRESQRSTVAHLPETDPSARLPRRVRRAVRSLKRRYREPLLAWLAGATTAEVSAALGCTNNMTYQRCRAGIVVLRHKLNPQPYAVRVRSRRRPGAGARKHDWQAIERLIAVDGLSVPEVALKHQISPAVVHNHLSRVRRWQQREGGRSNCSDPVGMASFAKEPRTIAGRPPSLSLS